MSCICAQDGTTRQYRRATRGANATMPRESDLRLDQLRRIGELGVSRDQRGCGRVVLLAPLVVSASELIRVGVRFVRQVGRRVGNAVPTHLWHGAPRCACRTREYSVRMRAPRMGVPWSRHATCSSCRCPLCSHATASMQHGRDDTRWLRTP